MKMEHKGLHASSFHRSEEHTSELQSHSYLVCRLLLENTIQQHGSKLIFKQVKHECLCRRVIPVSLNFQYFTKAGMPNSFIFLNAGPPPGNHPFSNQSFLLL